jgi:photosystem II stability/assembly factor-like uncharacterized protein
MRREGEMRHRILIGSIQALVLLSLMARMVVLPDARVASAAGDWEPTGLKENADFMITPASGAFYAGRYDLNAERTRYIVVMFKRSDDAGDTWRDVNLPPETSLLAVDPTDHSIIFAAAGSTLNKSTDGGDSWTPIVSEKLRPFSSTNRPANLAISPADHQLVYLALQQSTSVLGLYRSRDGGMTWEGAFDEFGPSPSCGAGMPVLRPHPTDPARVLGVYGCSSYGGDLAQVSVSTNQGTTWTRRGAPSFEPYITGIRGFAGWQGSTPDRLYVTTRHAETTGQGRQTRLVGQSLFRSDDEGRTWTKLTSNAGQGTIESGALIGDVAMDPADPDVVYLSTATSVQTSDDGGYSWEVLGSDIPKVASIALGVDGRNLYAATEGGIFRLRLKP